MKKSALRKLKRLQAIDLIIFLRTLKLCDSNVTCVLTRLAQT